MTLALPAVIFDVNTPFVAPILPTLALPPMFAVPGILAPVLVTTNCAVALPAVNTETLPLDAIVTFEVPFCIKPLLIVVILPVVAINVPVPRLPVFALPVVVIVFEPAVILPMMLAPVILPVAVILPAALIVPLPNCVFEVTLPTVKLVSVPTDVKFEVVIPEASVVPVKLAALGVLTVFDAAVNCP